MCEPSYQSGLQPHPIWRQYVLPVVSYRRLKNGRNWRLWRLQPRIAKIGTYAYIHAVILINHTGHDVTTYFRPEARAKRQLKMPLQTASGGISWELFQQRSPNFTRLSGITGPRQVLDTTSLVASGRLQNITITKYFTKLTRETGQAGQSQIIQILLKPDSPMPLAFARRPFIKQITYCYTVVLLPDQ